MFLRQNKTTLLELIHKYGKVVDYKNNIQTSIVFEYTSSEHSENKIKKI